MSDISDIKKIPIYYNCSLGHDCTSATLFQKKNLKFESYPFDWLISSIPDIIDCLETDFKHFLYRNGSGNRHKYYNNIHTTHHRMNDSNYN